MTKIYSLNSIRNGYDGYSSIIIPKMIIIDELKAK